MEKTRGQALVEFVLILPVFLLLVFGAIDFGRILYEKYRLQNDLDTVKEWYIQNQEQELNRYLNQHQLTITYDKNKDYTIIFVSKKLDIITPGLSHVLHNPYTVTESITVLNETE